MLSPNTYSDDRGFFLEIFSDDQYQNLGIRDNFVQENHSRSTQNVLRGLHFNKKKPQAQLVSIISGAVFDVVVDIRPESITYGEWFGVELREDGIKQIYMPPGFAHGFCVLSSSADLHYKVSQYYNPEDDGGLKWDDSSLGINWPITSPILSTKDQNNLTFEGFIQNAS